MNSRLKNIRNINFRRQRDNVPEYRNNSKKRKNEDDESAPRPKRPFLSRDPPNLQPYDPEEANVYSWGRRQPREQSREQPKRYSANNRLKRIRDSLEPEKQADKTHNDSPSSDEVHHVSPLRSPGKRRYDPPVDSSGKVHYDPALRSTDETHYDPPLRSTDKTYDPPFRSPGKTQSGIDPGSNTMQTISSYGGTSNQRKRFVVTARPSSLQERISNIRSSTGFNRFNESRRSTYFNTTGGGWFKSVDVEGKSNRNQQGGVTTSSNVTATSFKIQASLATDDRVPIQARIVSAKRLSSNNFANDSINESTANDSSTSTAYADSPANNNILDENISALRDRSNTGSTSHTNSSSKANSEDNAMDWSYFEENETLSNLQELRKNVKIASANPQTPFQEVVAKESVEIQHNKNLANNIYIVVDTNIFLSHLDTVKKAMKLQINGIVQPVILVPWVVIQELDYIKDGRSENRLKDKAQWAIRFINDCLSSKTNLKGQSVRDAAQQDFASSNFDDGILHCCLQIRERRNRAILLSNDVNLRNKAMTEDFETYSHDQIFRKLDPFHLSLSKPPVLKNRLEEDDKIKDIKIRLTHMCTLIILTELKKEYKELWNKLGNVKKLPWTLQDCLDLFERYWMPVFQMKIPKQCLKHIEIFSKYLNARNGVVSDGEKLLNFGLTLCIHLKAGYACYFETIKECIDSMQALYDAN